MLYGYEEDLAKKCPEILRKYTRLESDSCYLNSLDRLHGDDGKVARPGRNWLYNFHK